MKCEKCGSFKTIWHLPAINDDAEDMVEVGFYCEVCEAEFYTLVPFNQFIPVD